MSLMPDTAFTVRTRKPKGPTADEKRHMGRVAALGCCICGGPAEVHHIKHQTGIGRKSSPYDTIPLCPPHHRTGGYGVALHAGVGAWEMTFGRQTEMLERVREMLK